MSIREGQGCAVNVVHPSGERTARVRHEALALQHHVAATACAKCTLCIRPLRRHVCFSRRSMIIFRACVGAALASIGYPRTTYVLGRVSAARGVVCAVANCEVWCVRRVRRGVGGAVMFAARPIAA